MKQLFTKSISVALVVLMLLTFAAEARPDCSEARGSVAAYLTAPAASCPAGTIAGVAGDVFDASANLIGTTAACLTGLAPSGNNGALHATLTHTFNFNAGAFAGMIIGTQDQAILSPVAPPVLYRVNNNLEITTGGSGFLRTHGTVNFADGEVKLRYNGRICAAN